MSARRQREVSVSKATKARLREHSAATGISQREIVEQALDDDPAFRDFVPSKAVPK